MSFKSTKELYLSYLNCPLSFYKKLHKEEEDKYELRTNFSKRVRKDMMDALAKRFPNAIRLEDTDLDILAQRTKELLDRGETSIINAVFKYKDVYAEVDFFNKKGDGWQYMNLKSIPSTVGFDIVKNNKTPPEVRVYLKELAYQKYVIEKNNIKNIFPYIMMVNINYKKNEEEHDYIKLLSVFMVEKFVTEYALDVSSNLKKMYSMTKEPTVAIGNQCKKPFVCPFKDQCWKGIGKDSIYSIPKLKGERLNKLVATGAKTIHEIQDMDLLTDEMKKKVQMVLSGRVRKNPMALMMSFLNRLKYPIYHLDFETFFPIIPMYPKTRTGDTIPFQYSLHIEHKDGTIEHKEFIHEESTDPRLAFVNSLINDIPADHGSIMVYNKAFEYGVLESLAELYPDIAPTLKDYNARMVDLWEPFRSGAYYHPDMYYSTSLKFVLPALVPSLTYDNLGIKNGEEAMLSYEKMVFELDGEEKEKVKQDLLEYCKMDTLAMVELLKVLKKK